MESGCFIALLLRIHPFAAEILLPTYSYQERIQHRCAFPKSFLAEALKAARKQHFDAGNIAADYIALGDKDEAFAWLDKAYAERSNYMSSLKVWGLYDPIRSDPRFLDLERRVKLPQ